MMSHKFTIEVELEVAKYCGGCPCLTYSYGHGNKNEQILMCGFHYWDKYNGTTEVGPQQRPQACIDAHDKQRGTTTLLHGEQVFGVGSQM